MKGTESETSSDSFTHHIAINSVICFKLGKIGHSQGVSEQSGQNLVKAFGIPEYLSKECPWPWNGRIK